MSELKIISKGVLISRKAQIADSFTKKMFGLINPNQSRFLIINTRFGIHTYLLKQSIDVIVLNNSFQVVKIKSNLKPNKFYFYNPKYYTVIEMPKDSIEKYQIKINDKISIA